MNKCLECGAVFEKPLLLREPHGETIPVCPTCCGAYEPAIKCTHCGDFFHSEDDFYNRWCCACAKLAFTDELGVGYIQKSRRCAQGQSYTLEADFYLKYLYGA